MADKDESTAVYELRKAQGVAYLGITGGMKTTPTTEVTETLVNFPQNETIIMGEARMGVFRLEHNSVKRLVMDGNILEINPT